MIEYSDELFFNEDMGCFDDRDYAEDRVEDTIRDNFDEEDWVNEQFSSAGDLWRHMCHNNCDCDDIRDDMGSDIARQAWDSFSDASSEYDDDGRFECEGNSFCRLRTARVTF